MGNFDAGAIRAGQGDQFEAALRCRDVTGDAEGDLIGGTAFADDDQEVIKGCGGEVLMRIDQGGECAGDLVHRHGTNRYLVREEREVIDGDVSVVFSTLAAGADDSHALLCSDGSGVSVRNSILVSLGEDPEIVCLNSEVVHSFIEANSGLPFKEGWFKDFEKGDFHLNDDMSYPIEIATAASWQTGDPSTDIDGEQRPANEAAPHFAGADQP